MTGAREIRMASTIVESETCDRSTSMPSRFISRITSSPKPGRRPCHSGSSVAASAQSWVAQCVSVMYRTPRS